MIAGGNSILNMPLNTCSTLGNAAQTLDIEIGVRPLDKLKVYIFNYIIWPTSYSTLRLLALTCYWLRFWTFTNNNLVISKTCSCFLAKSTPFWLNSTVQLYPLKSKVNKLQHIRSISHPERRLLGRRVHGWIVTKHRSTHIVRPISLVHTHQVPLVLALGAICILNFPILLGMEGHAKPQ